MTAEQRKIRRRKRLLKETRDLLLNVKQQYDVPLPTIQLPRRSRVVRDFMRKDAPTVKPDTPLMDASRELLSKGVTHLPVLKGDKLVGIVTRTDILQGIVDGRKTVGEVMTTQVVAVKADDSAQSVMRKASESDISVLPVVNADGDFVGIVSVRDLRARLDEL